MANAAEDYSERGFEKVVQQGIDCFLYVKLHFFCLHFLITVIMVFSFFIMVIPDLWQPFERLQWGKEREGKTDWTND